MFYFEPFSPVHAALQRVSADSLLFCTTAENALLVADSYDFPTINMKADSFEYNQPLCFAGIILWPIYVLDPKQGLVMYLLTTESGEKPLPREVMKFWLAVN